MTRTLYVVEVSQVIAFLHPAEFPYRDAKATAMHRSPKRAVELALDKCRRSYGPLWAPLGESIGFDICPEYWATVRKLIR